MRIPPNHPSDQQSLSRQPQPRSHACGDRCLKGNPRVLHSRPSNRRLHLCRCPFRYTPSTIDIIVKIQKPPHRRPPRGRASQHRPERMGPVPRQIVTGTVRTRQRHPQRLQHCPPLLPTPRPLRERGSHVEESPQMRTPDHRIHNGETDIDRLRFDYRRWHNRCGSSPTVHHNRRPLAPPIRQRDRAGRRRHTRHRRRHGRHESLRAVGTDTPPRWNGATSAAARRSNNGPPFTTITHLLY